MKTIATTCLLAVTFTLAAHAINRPDNDQTQNTPKLPDPPATIQQLPPSSGLPEAAPPPQAQNLPKPAERAWLGLTPTPVPDALISQLELSGNPGVLIQEIAPDSPAKKAGLKDHDIILSINDTPIRKTEDIAQTISSGKAGEQVKIHLIRGGKHQDISATLETAPANIRYTDGLAPAPNPNNRQRQRGAWGTPNPQLNNPALPANPRQRFNLLRKSLMDLPDDWDADFEELEARMNSLMQSMQNGALPSTPGTIGSLQSSSSGTFNLTTNEGSISVTTVNGKTNVKVTDPRGTLLYEGPYNTDAEKAAVPESARKQLERLSFPQ